MVEWWWEGILPNPVFTLIHSSLELRPSAKRTCLQRTSCHLVVAIAFVVASLTTWWNWPFTYGFWLWYVFGLGSESDADTASCVWIHSKLYQDYPSTSKPSEAALPPGAAVVHGTEAQSGGMGTGCLCFGSERPCHGEDVAMKYHEGICMLQRQMGYPQVIITGGNSFKFQAMAEGSQNTARLNSTNWQRIGLKTIKIWISSHDRIQFLFFRLSGIKPTICICDLDVVAWAVLSNT